MTLTITLLRHGKRPKSVSTAVGDLPLSVLNQLWEAEQLLNSIPGVNLRVHIEVSE
jgi:hypothetical protein